jgi:hypothetical protein
VLLCKLSVRWRSSAFLLPSLLLQFTSTLVHILTHSSTLSCFLGLLPSWSRVFLGLLLSWSRVFLGLLVFGLLFFLSLVLSSSRAFLDLMFSSVNHFKNFRRRGLHEITHNLKMPRRRAARRHTKGYSTAILIKIRYFSTPFYFTTHQPYNEPQ